jgi:hypothetical protein
VSIGAVLAAARHQAALTITQVSQRTRIRETIIRGIERDDFSACGGDFYARGNIRAIGRATGVDGEPLVREYEASRGTLKASTAAGSPWPSAPLRSRERRRPNWSVAVLVVLAAAAGLVTYHLVASQPAGSVVATARKPVTAHKTARKHLAPAPLAARHGPRHVVISLTAVSEPCWADLTAPGGATIFQGIIDLGISCSPGLIVLSLACRWRTCWAPRQAGWSPRTSRSLLGPATRCVSSALPASLSSAAEPVPSSRAGPGQLC